jgi:hypothetical protein
VPAGVFKPRWGPRLYMEQISSIKTEKTATEQITVIDIFDSADRFLEKKLYPFVAVAVPVYLAAHIILLIINSK